MIQSAKFKLLSNGVRMFGTSNISRSLVEVKVEDNTGYSVVAFNRKPTNSLNLELVTEFSAVLDDLDKNNTKGVILTSSFSTVFCPGIDVLEFYNPNPQRITALWTTIQDVWLKLYGAKFPISCAINGHAPAGGCLLALSCDYRVMSKGYTIGLNETRLGLVCPTWFIDTMENVIGYYATEQALTLGSLFTTEEAKKVGLIDDISVDKEDALLKCTKWLDQFKKVNMQAMGMTKQAMRRQTLENLDENRDKDLKWFLNYIQQPKLQKGFEVYLAGLKAKK